MITIEKIGKQWVLTGTYLQETRTGHPAVLALEPMRFNQRYVAAARKVSWERSDAEVAAMCEAILAGRRAHVAELLAVRADRARQFNLFEDLERRRAERICGRL